jgi:hypothetical protein
MARKYKLPTKIIQTLQYPYYERISSAEEEWIKSELSTSNGHNHGIMGGRVGRVLRTHTQ